jgi:xanthine dehydrogenase accessory factor
VTARREVPRDVLEELVRLRREGRPVVLATVVSARGSTPRAPGAKMLVLLDGSIVGTVGGGVREAEVIAAAAELHRRGGARLVAVDFQEGLAGGQGPICGGSMEVFMERIDPARRIVIAGAGHVGQALHRTLALLDLATVVVDPRAELNDEPHVPGAEHVVEPYETGLASLTVGPADGIVIVTPGHEHDEVVLRGALATEAGYVGMIGSKRKVAAVLKGLRADGYGEEQVARIHAPIGLDIGAETPAEIAVAIAAEIVATFRKAG